MTVVLPVSPNTVLANALNAAEDVLAPRIRTTNPASIVFVVGTQINGVPHLGTSLVQSLTLPPQIGSVSASVSPSR
ncbi:hypothetical protein ACFQ51_52565 [Streptomyces kaempferi]